MIVQSTNSVPVLNTAENNSVGQQADMSAVTKSGTFSTNFLEQLALLHSNANNPSNTNSNNLQMLLANNSGGTGNDAVQDMQNFAAFFGKSAPTAKKIDLDINLDATLNTLTDVLQYLQNLNSERQTQQTVSTTDNANSNSPFTSTDGADKPANIDPTLDPAALAALLQQAAQANQTNLPGLVAQTKDINLTAAQLQPSKSLPTSASSVLTDMATNLSMPNALAVNNEPFMQQKLATNLQVDSKQEANAAATHPDQPHSSAGESATPISLFGDQQAMQNSTQDKQPGADSGSDDINLLTQPSNAVELDKNQTKMASDIAQLNQAVNNNKAVDAPAMTTHLHHPDWDNELGQKLIWMHKQDIPSAELRLNPEHLGPISVKIDVNQDQTSVQFTAQNAEVKQAIEAALPKLREMLGGQQLNLLDVNVSQQQSDQNKSAPNFFQTASEQNRRNQSANHQQADQSATPSTVNIIDEIDSGKAIVSNGLLSLFA